MKKIILLLIVASSFTLSFGQKIDLKDFKVDSKIGEKFTFNENQRFKYQFNIRGDYSYKTNKAHEIKLSVFYNNTSTQNLVSLIRWNREDDIDLIFNSYTNKKMWSYPGYNWNNRNFTIKRGDTFILKVQYGNTTKEYFFKIPNIDTDGDGIFDQNDRCPSLAGNQSNLGCPGNPDYIIDKNLTAVYDDTGKKFQLINISNTNRPRLYKFGGILNFCTLVIKNIGNGEAVFSSKVRFFISSNTILDNSDIGLGSKTTNISSLKPNQTTDSNCLGISQNHSRIKITIEGQNNKIKNLPNGDYYLGIIIDQKNELQGTESNSNNNSYFMPFRLTSTAPKSLNSKNTPYNLTIWNLLGQTIINKTIKSKAEEEIIQYNLQKGLYFIKSQNKTYKYYQK